MISTALFPKFRVSELMQFLSDVSDICVANRPEGLKIESEHDSLVQQTHHLEIALKKNRDKTTNKRIIELDERRYKAFASLTLLSRGYSLHFDPTKRSAGEKLRELMNKHSNTSIRSNYQAETKKISKFINELETNMELLEAILVLDMAELVDELKEVNKLFHQQYLNHLLNVVNSPTENLTKLRKNAISSYHELTRQVSLFAETSGGLHFLNFAKQLNELISKYNAIVSLGSASIQLEDKASVSHL